MGKGAERAPVELMPPHMLALKQHRAHNFSAGAAMFDTNVMAHLQNNFLSYDGSGMGLFVSPKPLLLIRCFAVGDVSVFSFDAVLSVLCKLQEMSQRDPGGPVQSCIARAEANLKMLLDIPDNYKVLFFQVSAK